MNVLWRFLGFTLLGELASRLPAAYARAASVALLVVANLIPIYGAWRGWMGVGDVFVVYWFENVVVWFFSIIRIATARAPIPAPKPGERLPGSAAGAAAFFAFHYGLFTFVHGIFTVVLVAMSGSGFVHYRSWLVVGAALAVSHLLSLVIHWFGRGERYLVNPVQAMWRPYPRMLVLHVAIIGSFFLGLRDLADGEGSRGEFTAVLLLAGLKLLVDLGLHLRERAKASRAAARATPAGPGAVRTSAG